MTFTQPTESSPLTCVLGIDPGVSTGLAFAFQSAVQGQGWKYSTSTLITPEQVWEHIKRPAEGRLVVVIERFHAQLISKYGLHTVSIIGGVEALCWSNGIELVKDTPQQRKPYLEMARRLVIPEKDVRVHEQRHEVDAMSHVARYLYQQGVIRSLQC